MADGCNDRTVAEAKSAGGSQLTIESLATNVGVGAARAHAVACIKTEYAVWLDADDEILPSHPNDMLTALKAGADLVFGGGVLIDGVSGALLKDLPMPDFMLGADNAVRCFERSWYPVPPAGFNVPFARKVGYDPSFRCVEDYDFLLRAIVEGGKVVAIQSSGYRYHHALTSISRSLPNTLQNVQRSLSKHSFSNVEDCLRRSQLQAVEQCCVLAGMALYRGDFLAARKYADRVKGENTLIVTYGLEANKLGRYLSSSASAMLCDWQLAHDTLMEFPEEEDSADVWNNLGVILHHLGEGVEAKLAFTRALGIMPGYRDAQENLYAQVPKHYTLHPLRRQPSRNTYG